MRGREWRLGKLWRQRLLQYVLRLVGFIRIVISLVSFHINLMSFLLRLVHPLCVFWQGARLPESLIAITDHPLQPFRRQGVVLSLNHLMHK